MRNIVGIETITPRTSSNDSRDMSEPEPVDDIVMSAEAAEDVFVDEDCPDDAPLTLSLLDLPVEIFLHICSFLDASTLVHGLGRVCKQFYGILRDDSLWKVRIIQIWPNSRYPVLPPDEDNELFWKQSCIAMEKQLAYWSDEGSVESLALQGGHYSTSIDGLLLMRTGKTLISGGRDRSLVCWKLDSSEMESPKCTVREMAHEGWIWDLTAVDNTIYSCSWDKTVKSWDLSDAGLEPITKFELDVTGALLCVTSSPSANILATGSFCKTVIMFDPRVGRAPFASFRPHRGPVLKVAMNTDYVLSASQDRTVSVWDQRTRNVVKTIEISKEFYPMSMVMQKDIVHVGDSGGNLHVLDPKRDYEPVKCYPTGHKRGITGLYCASGCLITGSLDKTVRIMSPTDPPQLIACLSSPQGEVASMDYTDGVLAVSGSSIQIWKPKTVKASETS